MRASGSSTSCSHGRAASAPGPRRSSRAALLGYWEGGPLCMVFGATYPERTAAVVMIGSFARRTWAPDYPWGPTREDYERRVEEYARNWGGPVGLDVRAPTVAHDP